jgi:hypothetical protein
MRPRSKSRGVAVTSARGAGRRRGDAQVAGQQVAGAARDHAQTHVGAHERGGGLHGGPVAAEHRDHVHPLLHPVRRDAARVARAAGGDQLDLPARRLERAHDRVHRALAVARRRGIGDEQHPRH